MCIIIAPRFMHYNLFTELDKPECIKYPWLEKLTGTSAIQTGIIESAMIPLRKGSTDLEAKLLEHHGLK